MLRAARARCAAGFCQVGKNVRRESTWAVVIERIDGLSKRMEERIDTLSHNMNKGFAEVDKRFEQVDKRFEQVDKRFEQVDKRFTIVDKHFAQVEKRLGSVENKLGHSLEYQLRLEVAREYGRDYAEQDVVDCIINLVAHVPQVMLIDSPKSMATDRIMAMCEKISEDLIRRDVPAEFMRRLIGFMNLTKADNGDGTFNMHLIRAQAMVRGQWLALDQLENFFNTPKRKDKLTLLPSCKGPGLLLMVFLACPDAIFQKDKKLSLYTELEFDFMGKINLFDKDKEVTGTIEVGEGKSSLDAKAISQLALRLDVIRCVLEKCALVRHRVTKKRGSVKLQVSKIGRMFVPKSIISQDEQRKIGSTMKATALKHGFSFHLHRL